ncbi:MAG TPA: MoaD/ThiS family protein [Anaerolineales bacterium]|nr:MoaD/ThiS family protein [Anaerolineales bacterium]
MQINVKLFGILRDQLPATQKGKTQVELQDGASVADLLAHLNITRRVEVAVGDDIEADMDHILTNGDQVDIFTAIGGG